MRHGLFFCRFRTGGDLGSYGARRGHGARRVGPRLRSGAFAPDFPCLILVIAYGDSFGFRWAYRRPTHRAPQPHRARAVENTTGLGAGGLLGVFFAVLVVRKILPARAASAARAASQRLRDVVRFRVLAARGWQAAGSRI